MKQIFLYGLGGAKDQYRVIRYEAIDEEFFSIRNIVNDAKWLKIKYPSIEHVYAIDNRRGLRRDYIEAIKTNSIESCFVFRDILESEGLKII